MNENDILSVCLITYNHEKFVAQAIESILKQNTNFNWKLVIADDCSTDQTLSILREYQQKYPEKIHLILQEKNVGPAENFIQLISFPKSKYIAYLEGDDYWIDSFKLQKQVDFLEANSDYVIHSSGAKLIKDDILTEESIGFGKESKAFEITDFYRNNNLVSCTIMFRNVLHEFPDFYKKLAFGDWFLYILLMHKTGGKSYRLNENLSAYRIHNTSAMANLNDETFLSKHFTLVIAIKKYLNLQSNNKQIVNSINIYALQLFHIAVKKSKFKAFKIFFENFIHCGFKTPFKQYLALIK